MSNKPEDFDVRLARGQNGERYFVVSEGADSTNVVFGDADRLKCEEYVAKRLEEPAK